MPTFDLVVVGCGGGPNEHNLSSYLLKPSEKSWKDGIVAIEAGSGHGALAHILEKTPTIFGQPEHVGGGNRTSDTAAADVLSWIRCYLITHAHMDHISSLVLCAGSLAGPAKSIFAVPQTLRDIEQVFSDRLWPKLASWDSERGSPLIYKELQLDTHYKQIFDGISVRAMRLSHGRTRQKEVYESSAFFIKHDATSKEFLFFGDVEADTISNCGWNREIWRIAAQKIPNTLSVIFIECSYLSGRTADRLYGHMSPEYLAAELVSLAEEVARARKPVEVGEPPARKKQRLEADPAAAYRNALAGVQVYIIHCKEGLDLGDADRPVQRVIAEQVESLVEKEKLGVKVVAVEQGMLIHI